eukprot:scaffold16483_cov112-Isochrysis_galbana.AAC.1
MQAYNRLLLFPQRGEKWPPPSLSLYHPPPPPHYLAGRARSRTLLSLYPPQAFSIRPHTLSRAVAVPVLGLLAEQIRCLHCSSGRRGRLRAPIPAGARAGCHPTSPEAHLLPLIFR